MSDFSIQKARLTIDPIRELVYDDLIAVQTLMLNTSHSSVDLINDLVNHIVKSGGKRIRPLLILLTCHACHYEGEDHIKLASMIEFFHTASLLHDDVIDQSTLRRGQKTANTIWGDKASILVGDYLFTRHIQLMLQIGNLNIMKNFMDIAHQISCGEIKQLVKRHHVLSNNDYFDVIRSKTSLLFAACSQLSALLSETDAHLEKALYHYGLHLGNAFQLTDDALDYCADVNVIGKNIGDDLADGKTTMPLLHVLQHGTSKQKEQIQHALSKGTRDDLPDVLRAIHETNAIEHTKSIALNEAQKAQKALNSLPESVYKDALHELAHYAALRDH